MSNGSAYALPLPFLAGAALGGLGVGAATALGAGAGLGAAAFGAGAAFGVAGRGDLA